MHVVGQVEKNQLGVLERAKGGRGSTEQLRAAVQSGSHRQNRGLVMTL